jgi:hypothetical protein
VIEGLNFALAFFIVVAINQIFPQRPVSSGFFGDKDTQMIQHRLYLLHLLNDSAL